MVPDVECVNVLKKVPELQCTPEIFEDCNEVEKKIPYLEEQEDCVEITFDECQEVKNLSSPMLSFQNPTKHHVHLHSRTDACFGLCGHSLQTIRHYRL